MRLFGRVNARIDRLDGAVWLTPVFELSFTERLALFWLPDAVINRRDRAQWLTPPFTLLLRAPPAIAPVTPLTAAANWRPTLTAAANWQRTLTAGAAL